MNTQLLTSLVAALAASCASLSMASEPGQYGNSNDISQHSATMRALAAQRSGDIASGTAQHQDGQSRAASYKRYRDSYKQPIPASFIDTKFNTD